MNVPYGYMNAVRAATAIDEAGLWTTHEFLSLDTRLRDVETFLQGQGFVPKNNPTVAVTQTAGARDPWSTWTQYNWTMSNPFQPSAPAYSWTSLMQH